MGWGEGFVFISSMFCDVVFLEGMVRYLSRCFPPWFVGLYDVKAALLHSVNARISIHTLKAPRGQQKRAALYYRFSRIVAPVIAGRYNMFIRSDLHFVN